MNEIVIKIKDLSKYYNLGSISSGTLNEDLALFWSKFRGKDQPKSLVTEKNDLKKVTKSKKVWALNKINLEVAKGEILGIIGNNGAGKSTLLKILSRITSPSKGSIKLKGRVASLLEVGTGFHPELTGLENIYLNGSILGMSKNEINQKLIQIIEFSGIEKYIDTPVKRYSSGMRVRLGFSVAAHLDPEILLIDEVLAVGDAEFQKKCISKMKSVSSQGRTVLFVSHNMLAIENLCEKVIVLLNGELKYIGTPKDAIQYYVSKSSNDILSEVKWETKDVAPGNQELRLKAIRVLSNGNLNEKPRCDEDIQIQIDYWNLKPRERRYISIHVQDVLGLVLFTAGNMSFTSSNYDEWSNKKYPKGLFRTNCVIPKNLLNPGVHSITLFINKKKFTEIIIEEEKIISFEVQESNTYRTEYFGEWLGAVRPKLSWNTEELNE
tara:strand:- start:2582 stop:3892 length:1311 start_codon:yes stop_codon:yes gene_type:complete